HRRHTRFSRDWSSDVCSSDLIFLALVVMNAHHMVVFMGLFLFFLGFTTITQEFQDEVQVKSSLMVGFFLGGLIVLGSLQKWWLRSEERRVGDKSRGRLRAPAA